MNKPDRNNSLPIRETWQILIFGLVFLSLFSLFPYVYPASVSTLYWLILSVLFWIYCCYQLYIRLDLNRPNAGELLYPDLGWANRLSIMRGFLIAMTGGFLFQDWPDSWLMYLPGVLYTLAAIIDRVDGFVARKSGRTSLLGIDLDTLFDALGLAVAPLLAVLYGQIHWSYLLFSGAYYLFQWGIHRRKQLGLPVYTLPPNKLRRAWAGFQMGFIGVVLFPIFSPPVTTVAGFAFMLPVLIGFTIDWCIVSGRIDPQQTVTATRFSQIDRFGQTVLLPLLRLVITALILAQVQIPDSLIDGGLLLAAFLVLFGIAGRIAALVLIGLLGILSMDIVLNTTGLVLLFGTVWLLLMGTGHYSLWRRDEDWVNRYDGT